MRKIAVIICIWFLCSSFGLSGESGDHKIQLELYGGFSMINPEDLNLRNGFEEAYKKFWNEDFLAYALEKEYIQSLDIQKQGVFNKLKHSIPMGLRLKYNLSKTISLSLGLKYTTGSRSSEVTYQYTSGLQAGTENTSIYTYSPFTVFAKGFIPMIGVHFSKILNPHLKLEAYVSGGPLFGSCQLKMGKFTQEYSTSNSDQEYYYELEYDGKGIGYALDTGIQVRYPLLKNMDIFLEGGYAFQRIKKVSGMGKLDYDEQEDIWEGDWGILEYQESGLWGSINILYFSNSWEGREESWIRGFNLDLSGFQIKLGITYYF